MNRKVVLYISVLTAILSVSAPVSADESQADSTANKEYTLDIFKETAIEATSKSRVTMPMGDAGRVFMINLPFKVSSYYFGANAKVYEMKSIPSVSATDGCNTLYLKEVNIDSIYELPVATPLLIKCNHTETEIKATRNLFKEEMVTVNPEIYSKDISDASTGVTYCNISSAITSKKVWQPGDNATYVLDNGFLKRVNSSDYKLPACRVFITNSNSYPNASVNIAKYEDGVRDSATLVISHASIKPLVKLNNYVSFYNEASDFEICEEENGNPKAKVYTVFKTTEGTDDVLALHEVQDGIIQKGSAVLISAQTDGNDLKMRMVTNGSTDTDAYTNNILRGVTVNTPVSELCEGGEEYIYTLGRNNEQLALAFQQYDKSNTLTAYRAYIKASDLAGAKAYYMLSGVATSISNIGAAKDAKVYDLNGIEVKKTVNNKVYIIDNKKVIVK